MPDTKNCPFCAEEIRHEAVYCRYCRSNLQSRASEDWFRGHPEARIAGVCAAIAHAFAVPVAAVRLAFVVFTVFFHVGLLVYIGLWLLVPPTVGEPSHAERGLQWALRMVREGADGCPRRRNPTPEPGRGPGGAANLD